MSSRINTSSNSSRHANHNSIFAQYKCEECGKTFMIGASKISQYLYKIKRHSSGTQLFCSYTCWEKAKRSKCGGGKIGKAQETDR